MNENISRKEFDKLAEDICDIKTAVIGDAKFGHVGLVKRMHVLERWKESVTLKIASVTGIVTGGSFILKYFLTGHW